MNYWMQCYQGYIKTYSKQDYSGSLMDPMLLTNYKDVTDGIPCYSHTSYSRLGIIINPNIHMRKLLINEIKVFITTMHISNK